MTRFVMITTAAVLLSCGSAFAQSSLGMTSPLGIGPGSPVPSTRIPLGATTLASPGISPPMTSITSMTTGTRPACTGLGGSIAQSSFGTIGTLSSSATATSSVTGTSTAGTSSGTGTSTAGTSVSPTAFDGGGMAGTASGTCPVIGSSSLAGPAASASSPTGMASASGVGRVGIPMGASELGAGGLSPLFTVPTTTLVPDGTTSTSGSMSTLGSTTSCSTSGLSSTTGATMTGTSTSSGTC